MLLITFCFRRSELELKLCLYELKFWPDLCFLYEFKLLKLYKARFYKLYLIAISPRFFIMFFPLFYFCISIGIYFVQFTWLLSFNFCENCSSAWVGRGGGQFMVPSQLIGDGGNNTYHSTFYRNFVIPCFLVFLVLTSFLYFSNNEKSFESASGPEKN